MFHAALTESAAELEDRYDVQFMYVDDGSSDGSLAALRGLHEQDPRGFVIDYLQAGPAVLEVFTFTAPGVRTEPAPPPGDRLGLRALGLATAEGAAPATADPDGVPLRQVPAR